MAEADHGGYRDSPSAREEMMRQQMVKQRAESKIARIKADYPAPAVRITNALSVKALRRGQAVTVGPCRRTGDRSWMNVVWIYESSNRSTVELRWSGHGPRPGAGEQIGTWLLSTDRDFHDATQILDSLRRKSGQAVLLPDSGPPDFLRATSPDRLSLPATIAYLLLLWTRVLLSQMRLAKPPTLEQRREPWRLE